jgi:hypothetical protein
MGVPSSSVVPAKLLGANGFQLSARPVGMFSPVNGW